MTRLRTNGVRPERRVTSLDLTDSQKERLTRIFNLPDLAFDQLIAASETRADRVASNVKRLIDMADADMVRDVIKRAAMGQEIFWELTPGAMEVKRLGPMGVPEPYTQPTMNIILGMRGALIGPEYNVWYIVSIDPIPNEEQVEKGVRVGIEHLHQQKAAQMNGGRFIQGRPVKDNPQA
jgi:hypothetical protein